MLLTQAELQSLVEVKQRTPNTNPARARNGLLMKELRKRRKGRVADRRRNYYVLQVRNARPGGSQQSTVDSQGKNRGWPRRPTFIQFTWENHL